MTVLLPCRARFSHGRPRVDGAQRELRERNYIGRYTILKDWLQPQRKVTRTVASRQYLSFKRRHDLK
jgi:hypothetical protein